MKPAFDVGVVAKRYPDVQFIIYHSGYEPGTAEGPFVNGAAHRGIDTLIASLLENEVPPNSNVYAELGSTWRLGGTSSQATRRGAEAFDREAECAAQTDLGETRVDGGHAGEGAGGEAKAQIGRGAALEARKGATDRVDEMGVGGANDG